MPTMIYKAADGKRLKSVTGINKIGQDPGGLIHWAWDLGIQGIDYREARDAAAEAGTVGHALMEAAVHNTAVDLSGFADAIKIPALNSFRAYTEWMEQTKIEILETEIGLVSEKYRFGGCVDALAKQNGKFVVCDWKTGALYPDYLCQVAAYGKLLEENKDGLKIEGYHLVRFGKETGNFSHHWAGDLAEDWELFLDKLQMAEKIQKQKKRFGK